MIQINNIISALKSSLAKVNKKASQIMA